MSYGWILIEVIKNQFMQFALEVVILEHAFPNQVK
jgi:hypothetical protein